MRKIFILLIGLAVPFINFAQWSLTGNAGTNPPTNFLGTTDAEPLVFKTDATEYMRLLTNGKLGIGITTPTTLLHVYGTTAANQAGISGTDPALGNH